MSGRMVIIGLTGSIGMGKSAAAGMLRRLRVQVHDADAAVHRLLGKNGAAVAAVARAFPGVVVDGVVDRGKLGANVFCDAAALKRLETILHPLVRRSSDRLLARAARRRARVVALDVPLLFETAADRRYDAIVVVSAPAFLQAQRVLRRPGMTVERMRQISTRQISDSEKRKRADFVVRTGLGKRDSFVAWRHVLRMLKHRRGRAWRPGYVERH
jgi:dephospho-CoA kinase